MFCSLLAKFTILCACHAKPHLNRQKWSVRAAFCTFWVGNVLRATTAFSTSQLPKWSGTISFCTFGLENVLRATTACTFSTSQLLKVLQSWGVFYIFASKCASRHNGVQFFISHLATGLRTGRFSEPTFRPSGATNHRKNTVNRDFPTFLHLGLLSSLSFSSLIFSLLLFSSLILPTSAFPFVNIVGSLTSKLHSTARSIKIIFRRLEFEYVREM